MISNWNPSKLPVHYGKINLAYLRWSALVRQLILPTTSSLSSRIYLVCECKYTHNSVCLF